MSQTKEHYDAVVIGVGGMGSAALYSLANHQISVCGIEQFGIAHTRGSSSGATRIIRKAYFEQPDYMPLLDAAYDMWQALEKESGVELKVDTGLILAGAPDEVTVSGLKACYAAHNRPHELLSPGDVQARFPQLTLRDETEIYYDPTAGFLHVEACVRTLIDLAIRRGASLFTNELVLDWSADGEDIIVRTNKRVIVTQRLVITAGAWARGLLRRLGVNADIWRRPVCWYRTPNMQNYFVGRLPIFYIELDYGHFYGFPAIDGLGVKVAEHVNPDVITDPDALKREITSEEEAQLRRFMKETMPQFQPTLTRAEVCMYTMTPDENFVLDVHPEFPNVVIGAGFSGHGFKFAPVVGEILSDLVLEGETKYPIGFLRLGRFDYLVT